MRWLLVTLFACVPDGAPPMYTSVVPGGLGAACASDSDCNNAYCFTGNNFLGTNADTFGGFCARPCSSDGECGAGLCNAGYDGNQYCYPPCDAPSHCRDNYLCSTIERRGVCEPASIHTVYDCDPADGPCTTFDGDPGGCLRYALGTGHVGLCLRNCVSDVDCHPGESCEFIDDTSIGGSFRGTLCF
jgi:hypothetical protein